MIYLITYITFCPAYVPVIVELYPDASKAIANILELEFPKTFFKK